MVKDFKRILVVDDEEKITDVVSSFLTRNGFSVSIAHSGRQALEMFDDNKFSLVVLDLMLPDISGEDVCREIRKKSGVPIIMLTAKVDESDLVEGLSLGADDYICKPFGLKELLARVQAVLRRSGGAAKDKNIFDDGELIVDFLRNVVEKRKGIATPHPTLPRKGGGNKDKKIAISLTPNEMRILTVLIKSGGRVFSREELIARAFGDEYEGFDRAIDSHIKNLRQKIENNPKEPVYILTVHGLGYRFGGKV